MTVSRTLWSALMPFGNDRAARNKTHRLSEPIRTKYANMCTTIRRVFSFEELGSVLSCLCLLMLTFSATLLGAQRTSAALSGIAWKVRGSWQVEGKSAPIVTGDAIWPGSLLQPKSSLQPGIRALDQSITILLPDGQRILYECFTVEDCARGFRVPSLYRAPEPLAVDMLARIRAVLVRESSDSSSGSETPLPRDEVVAALGSGNRVQIAGLAARLPNGRYTYDLRPLDHTNPPQFNLVLQKTAPSITLALPSSGLYVLTIADDLNTPRIDLFIAAVKPAQAASVEKSFGGAKALMKKWIGNYSGWPIHEFQWAYLQSLMMDPKPLSTGGPTGAVGKAASNAGVPRGNTADDRHRAGVAAEPTFSPRPGLFDGDTAVTLRCETPGATMRYTVDGSQPHTSSPIYRAPIMVKGTELTIKSFASAAGRKDSAVVTGIFRIRQ